MVKENQTTNHMELLTGIVDIKQDTLEGIRSVLNENDLKEVERLMKGESIKEKSAQLKVFLQKQLAIASKLVSSYEEILNQLANVKNETKTELKRNIKLAKEAKAQLNKALNKKIETMKDFREYTKDMNRKFWGYLNEPLTAIVLYEAQLKFQKYSEDAIKQMIPEAIEIGNIKFAGSKWGNKSLKDSYHTTDATFKIGTQEFGTDVKRSRELYTKSFTSKARVYDAMTNLLGGGMTLENMGNVKVGIKKYQTFKELLYAVVNYGAFASSGAQALKDDIVDPLTALVLTSDLITFIDDYIKRIHTEARDQLIITMGDEFYLTSDLLLNIKKELILRKDNMSKGGGWINLKVGTSGVADISNSSMDQLWGSKQEKINKWKSGDKTATNGYKALFNYIYASKSSGVSDIVKKVLSSSMRTWMSISFNKKEV